MMTKEIKFFTKEVHFYEVTPADIDAVLKQVTRIIKTKIIIKTKRGKHEVAFRNCFYLDRNLVEWNLMRCEVMGNDTERLIINTKCELEEHSKKKRKETEKAVCKTFINSINEDFEREGK